MAPHARTDAGTGAEAAPGAGAERGAAGPLLEVEGLSLFYGDAQALDRVSLSVAAREIVAVVGANGAGKTSLIRAIAGMQKPAAGRVLWKGRDLTGWPSHRVCDAGIGQVAEGRQIFPSLSVLENLQLGAMIPRARAAAQDSLDHALTLFPRLAERRHQAAGTLSGGEQQMLAIGRCLMGRPELILFDEPSLGLAPTIVADVFRIIRTLHDEGLSIVLVEQNVSASLRLSRRGYVLENGRVVLSGRSADLAEDPAVRQAYLGL